LGKSWLDECLTSHPICGQASADENWYPGRLIDLSLMPQGILRSRYVTLSHCWGKIEFMRLTSETQERLEEGIELEAFPKTFREAFDFSCRLGARYIWIDSICILQDSAEDWLDQSSIMDLVYNNSLCNLSATAA
ncbi:heterokaryon incompatibility protein-domain-containing protein, partial [Tricladium varicosporioides]